MIIPGKEENRKSIKSKTDGFTVHMRDPKKIDASKIPDVEMKLLAKSIIAAGIFPAAFDDGNFSCRF